MHDAMDRETAVAAGDDETVDALTIGRRIRQVRAAQGLRLE
jgi:hypothetical protein